MNPANSPRVLRLLFKTPILVAAGLFVAYLLFGWFGAGPLIKWGAEKLVADKSGHRLALDKPEFDPLTLQLTVRNLSLTEPDGKQLAGIRELFVDFETMSLFRFAYIFDAIRLIGPSGKLALLPGGKLNWSPFIEAFDNKDEQQAGDIPRLLIRHFELKEGRVDLADQSVEPAFNMDFRPIELSLDEISTLPDDKGAYQISARTEQGAELKLKGGITLQPVAITGALALKGIRIVQLAPFYKGRVLIADPEGTASLETNYRLGYDSKKFSLGMDQLAATLEGLALRGLDEKEPSLRLGRLAVSGGRFDLNSRRFDLAEISLTGGSINLTRRADGRLNIQDWFPSSSLSASSQNKPLLSPQSSAASDKAAFGSAQPWSFTLGNFILDGVSAEVTDHSFITPLTIEAGNVRVGFKAEAKVGVGEPQVRIGTGEVEIGAVKFSSMGNPAPHLLLNTVAVQGIQVDLAKKNAEVAKLAVNKGALTAVRAADGSIPLLESLKSSASSTETSMPKSKPDTIADKSGWHYRLERAEINDFQVAARDEGVKPAASLTLDAINASVVGVTENTDAVLPVSLSLDVKEGGRFQAKGELVPARASLDGQLSLADLNLVAFQPYIGQVANLALTSGRAGSQGRFKIGDNKGRDKISYRGSFAVRDLLVKEVDTGNRFLAWKSLSGIGLDASTQAVHIDELKLDGLDAKLVIYKDKTVNLTRVLKTLPVSDEQNQTGGTGKTAEIKGASQAAFKLGVDRISIGGGEMDFADESLALPFGTRIHGLKGVINGISSQSGAPAQMEVDGLVDDFGLARAVGQIDFLDPAEMTDIKVVFRNVEMNRLTPYSATFAGRKIDSGKLSLDLEYKIKQRQLQGENQIIMDKLTLGERVESASAKSLPLDLAIAILEDSEGRIDLGLPVSGSLDDPQFSYGGIIWKAIINVITKIALAPFRALGSMLGMSSDKFENITFDVGDATLQPPEKEKLKQLAQVLGKRPGLALTVQSVWNAEADRSALKDMQIRRALAGSMGHKLAVGEDPGPVSTAQPKTQEGLEKLYGERFGEAALKMMLKKFAQANPEPPPVTASGRMLSRLTGIFKAKDEPLSQEDATALKGADLHSLLYQNLLEKEEVSDERLIVLAKERADAVSRELVIGGVNSSRISEQAHEKVSGVAREVSVKLGLTPAPKVAPQLPASGTAISPLPAN